MEHFIAGYKKYADFTGRASRIEYWMYFLFYIITLVVLSMIDGAIGLYNYGTGLGLLSSIYTLVSFIPWIALSTRRLHDTDRTGWWQLIVLIPLIGVIFLMLFFVLKGDKNRNSFGKNPLAPTNIVLVDE